MGWTAASLFLRSHVHFPPFPLSSYQPMKVLLNEKVREVDKSGESEVKSSLLGKMELVHSSLFFLVFPLTWDILVGLVKWEHIAWNSKECGWMASVSFPNCRVLLVGPPPVSKLDGGGSRKKTESTFFFFLLAVASFFLFFSNF